MRLGLGPISLGETSRDRLESLAAQAVASSFDAVWVAESRAEGAGGGLAAAALVAQSAPIRVGAVLEWGLYHPLHMAEDIAVADLTCQGRIEVLLRQGDSASARYGMTPERSWLEEFLRVLAAAMSGAHIQWNGEHLRVPARLDANAPVPERLAVNPRPAQPVVPVWVEAREAWIEELARTLGFGVAALWRQGMSVPAASGRWPGLLLCPGDAQPAQLLSAAKDRAGYFLVEAATVEQAASAGRRLAGPLRMPGFPEWISSGA